jgi:hypothetical protein
VFYYGKNFASMKQKQTKKGELKEEYQPLSVEKPGVEISQELAKNDSSDLIDKAIGNNPVGMDDIMNIIKGA